MKVRGGNPVVCNVDGGTFPMFALHVVAGPHFAVDNFVWAGVSRNLFEI